MKNYTLQLISFKQRIVNSKKRREITSITFYDKITFDLAKFLASKAECGLLFFDKKDKVCLKDSSVRAIGYQYHNGKGVIAVINKKPSYKSNFNDKFFYPQIDCITLKNKDFPWNKLDNILDEHADDFIDFSIEAYHIWGPNSLIPKGYENITSGLVKEGDYYFENDHWISVAVSFSPINIGDEIKQTGLSYIGKHNGRKEDDHINYCNQFIIRKKLKNIN